MRFLATIEQHSQGAEGDLRVFLKRVQVLKSRFAAQLIGISPKVHLPFLKQAIDKQLEAHLPQGQQLYKYGIQAKVPYETPARNKILYNIKWGDVDAKGNEK